MRTGAVEEGDRARIGGITDIEQLHASRLQPGLLGLIRHGQYVPHQIEGIRSYLGVRQPGLGHEVRLGRISDIQDREVDRGTFVGDVHDAAPIAGLLQPYPLATIAKATQVTVADQAHVFALCTIGYCGSTHRRFLRVRCGIHVPLWTSDAVQFCQ